MRVFDCVIYDGEADLLAARVETLADVVHRTVVVEANRTHQGDERLLSWPNQDLGIGDLAARVRYSGTDLSHLDDQPRGGAGRPGYQVRERAHRDSIVTAATRAGAGPGDLMLVSDVDEIPDPAAIRFLLDAGAPFAWPGSTDGDVLTFVQTMFVWTLDWRFPGPWLGTTAVVLDERGAWPASPQEMRDLRSKTIEYPGGWHFSWFGDDERRRRKLGSFSHAELADLADDLARRAEAGVDVNGVELDRVVSDEWAKLPEPIRRRFT